MRQFLVAFAACALIGIGSARGLDSASEKEVRAAGDAFVAAWNKHDAKAMAALWAPDGDLINPFGRVAKGRAEVEKLFSDEHTTSMKGSTYSFSNFTAWFPSPAVAVVDWDGEITGMQAPDGSPIPAFKHHVVDVYTKKGGKWWLMTARAMAFLPPPGAPPATK